MQRLFTQGTPVDCGILTPRKTRFYSRPNKLKHKPLVRGFLSIWCAPFRPPIPVLPIRFPLHVFLRDILQRRLKTTRTRLRHSRKQVIHTEMPPFREMPMSSMWIYLLPCLLLCLASIVKIYFFSLVSVYNVRKKALNFAFVKLLNILHFLCATINIKILLRLVILLFLDYNPIFILFTYGTHICSNMVVPCNMNSLNERANEQIEMRMNEKVKSWMRIRNREYVCFYRYVKKIFTLNLFVIRFIISL